MAKIKGDSMYTSPSDKEAFACGHEHPSIEKVEKFAREVLDKHYEDWLIVAKDNSPQYFKEVDKGGLLRGTILYNVKSGDGEVKARDIDRKGRVAMLLLDVVEAICEDDNETESFLSALHSTAVRAHRGDTSEVSEKKAKEEVKLDLLKGFFDTAVNSFHTYEGKEKFLKSCIGSVVPAKVLESGTPEAKAALRKSMRASIAGDSDGGELAVNSVDSMIEMLEKVLDAVDNGEDVECIASIIDKMAGASSAD